MVKSYRLGQSAIELKRKKSQRRTQDMYEREGREQERREAGEGEREREREGGGGHTNRQTESNREEKAGRGGGVRCLI